MTAQDPLVSLESSQAKCARWFTPIPALILGLGFISMIWITHTIADGLCSALTIAGCPSHWPISVFDFRVPPRMYYPKLPHILVAAVTCAVFALSLRILKRSSYLISLVVVFAFPVVLGSNLIQGWGFGLQRPIDGLGVRTNQYYHDAQKIQDPLEFISNYPAYQLTTLQTHARSHPPGAVLTFYYMMALLGDPVPIALMIAIVATTISGFSLYYLLRDELAPPSAGYLTFLFLMLPAVQIYYLATLDALIVALILTTLALVIPRRRPIAAIAGGLVLFLLSMLTFVFVFVMPPLAYYWLRSRPRNRGIPVAVATLLVAQLTLYALTGFSYIESFPTASRLENPNGYGLLFDPLSFIMIRIEGVAELLVFAGPYLLLAAYCGWRLRSRRIALVSMTEAGIVTLLAMMVVGVYRTGETGRAALFMFPLFVFPLVATLERVFTWDSPQARLLLSLVFSQGIIMQLVGNYFW